MTKLKKCPDVNSPEYHKIMDEYVASLTIITYDPRDLSEIKAWIIRNEMEGAFIIRLLQQVTFQHEADATAFKLWYTYPT